MLLQVQSYASGSVKPMLDPPLHICLATARAEANNDDDNNNNKKNGLMALTVGRKDGHIVFAQDKTVSRANHLRLRLVCDTIEEEEDEEDKDLACSTPEEREAAALDCENDDNDNNPHHKGVAVVLESMGKFGSIVLHEPLPTTVNTKKAAAATTNDTPAVSSSKKNNDDDSDATDDEMEEDAVDADNNNSNNTNEGPEYLGNGLFPSQFTAQNQRSSTGTASNIQPTLSPIATQLLQERNIQEDQIKWDIVPANETRVLKVLSLYSLLPSTNCRIIILCGKSGSTLVLTRVDPGRFGRSGLGKKKYPWTDKLHYIGAREVVDWSYPPPKPSLDDANDNAKDNNNATTIDFLIADKRDPTPKQLAAWSAGTPIVATSFLDALWNRTSPNDPLPTFADHLPTTAKASSNQFWTSTQPSSRLLQGATFGSTKAGDDIELLMQATGANVLRLYEADDPDTLFQDNIATSGYFGASNTRKLTSVLKRHRVPLVTLKTLAKAVVNQDPSAIDSTVAEAVDAYQTKLKEQALLQEQEEGHNKTKADGNEAKKKAEEEDVDSAKEEAEQRKKENEDKDGGDKDDEVVEVDSPQPKKQSSQAAEKQSPINKEPEEPMDTDEPPKEKEPGHINDKEKEPSDKDDDKEADKNEEKEAEEQAQEEMPPKKKSSKLSKQSQWMSSGSRGSTQQQQSQTPSQRKPSQPRDDDPMEEDKQDEEAEEAEETETIEGASQSQKSTKKRSASQSQSQSQSQATKAKRPRLSASDKDGWLQVAPKEDKQRQALVRTEDEIRQIMGYGSDEGDDSAANPPKAQTKTVVVVGPAVGQSTIRAKTKKRQTHGAAVPDFRAFRKNVVPTGAPQEKIRLRMDRVKESAGQVHEYQEQKQALEEQQRRADLLFRDAAPKTAGGRRRRGQ